VEGLRRAAPSSANRDLIQVDSSGYADFQQQRYLTCETLAVIAAIDRWREGAGHNYLSRMVSGPDRAGNYTVRFPGLDRPVTVTGSLLAQMRSRLSSQASSDGGSPSAPGLVTVLEAATIVAHRQAVKVLPPDDLLLGDRPQAYTIPGRAFGDGF